MALLAQGRACVFCLNAVRVLCRLSGTGTEGATLRIYLEAYDPNVANHHLDVQVALAEMIEIALTVSQLKQRTGRETPTVIT